MSATTAEAPEPETAEEGAAGAPDKKKGKFPSKKMMLLIGGPVALLIIGLAAAFFLGIFGGGSKEAEPAHHEAKAAPKPLPQFYELPDLLVNLNSSGGKRQSFLKLSVSLEVATPEDATRLKAMQPRIIDTFQTFLRDLRVEDLQGSEGVHLVREELLRRVTAVAEPVNVTGVLFREMLVQ